MYDNSLASTKIFKSQLLLILRGCYSKKYIGNIEKNVENR